MWRRMHDVALVMLMPGNLNEATLGPRRHHAVLDWANEFGGMYHLRFAWVNVRCTC